jgi:tetratricopeptide (TPR) repeat protein
MLGKVGLGLLVGLTVLRVGQGSLLSEEPGLKPEPKPPWQRLLQGGDAKKAKELAESIDQQVQEDKYPEAIREAKELLALRCKVQGEDHWETVTAQYGLKALEKVAALPAGSRREFATIPALRSKVRKLNAKRQYEEAQFLLIQILRIKRKLLGENHPDTATSLTNLALNLDAQAQYAEADLLYRQALELRRKLLGENHPDTATSLTNLALNLNARSKYPEAEPLLRQALTLRRNLLGEDHPFAVTSLNNLAYNLKAQGKYAEAEPLYRQALALFRKHLGENNPNTANSLMNLALNLNNQGKYDEAEPLYRQALALYRKLLGENHPQTANGLEYLAHNLNGQGKYAEAELLYRQALALYRKLLGENHPDTANGLNGLAINLDRQGKYAEAEPLYRQALALYRKLLGENHRDTAASLNNLASNLNNQAKYAEAEALYRQALALRRKLLGENHPHTTDSLSGLAVILNAQGLYAEAETLYRQALALRRKLLGENHPHTADSLNNLAINLNMQGKDAEAESLFRQALALRRKLLGENHPSIADSLNNMAAILNAQGKYHEAEALYRQSLALTRKLLGENHPHTASSLNNLAFNLDDQDKYAEAQALYRQGLALRRKLLGENHPLTAQSLNNVAANLNAQGKYDEAEPLYRQALALRRQLLGENHPDIAHSLNNLAANLNAQGKYDEAEPLYRQAVALYGKLLGENHPSITNNFNNLAVNLNAQGKYDEAEKYFEQAFDAYLGMRTASARAGIDRASSHSPLQRLAALQARKGKAEQAWQRLEQGLGRATWDELVLRHQRSVQEQAQLDRLLAQLTHQDRRILQTLSSDPPSPEQDQLRKDLLEQQGKLLNRLEELYRGLEVKYGVREGLSFQLEKIQCSLPPNTALLAWVDVVGEPKAMDPNGEHWAVLVKSRGKPHWVSLPCTGPKNTWTAADDKVAPKLKEALTGRTPVTASALAELSRQLTAQRITPLRPHLIAMGDLPAVQHLVVLPSSSMDGIPVELLVEGITVSYASSATFFAYLKEQKAPATSGVLALGDPLFDYTGRKEQPSPLPPGGILITAVTPGSAAAKAMMCPADVLLRYHQTDLQSLDDLRTAVAGRDLPDTIVVRYWRNGKTAEVEVSPGKLGVVLDIEPAPMALKRQRELDKLLASRGDNSWKPLPGTRGEVETLKRLFAERKMPVRVLTGSEASEQRLYDLASSGELSQVRFLHLATHGQMNPFRPLQSALILSRDHLLDPGNLLEDGQYPFDGRLTAQEVLRQWKLDAELVTLSACQTALGKQERGEGYMGFAQAVLLSGSRSVCLSLWKVDDTATMLLMDRFYRNLLGQRDGLAKPMGKAEALAEAKQWLRTLPRKEVLEKAAGLLKGVIRGPDEDLPPLLPERPEEPKDKTAPPYAHPRYWAAFILIGDPK